MPIDLSVSADRPRLLTTAEAAAALGCSPRYVLTLIQDGVLVAQSTSLGYLIAESSVARLADSRATGARDRRGHLRPNMI